MTYERAIPTEATCVLEHRAAGGRVGKDDVGVEIDQGCVISRACL